MSDLKTALAARPAQFLFRPQLRFSGHNENLSERAVATPFHSD
jgi:hypothetical protein